MGGLRYTQILASQKKTYGSTTDNLELDAELLGKGLGQAAETQQQQWGVFATLKFSLREKNVRIHDQRRGTRCLAKNVRIHDRRRGTELLRKGLGRAAETQQRRWRVFATLELSLREKNVRIHDRRRGN